ncbi:peptidylprolyl isomerase [Lysobacteraceae bacterium NML95-0200]|nr:peptidylprolyl isomerase [Xanthomonadaceae bacterium NML95-0200]
MGLAAGAAVAEPPLANEREKVGYMVGMDVGADPSLQAALPDVDMAAFEQSLRRVLGGEIPQMKPEDAQQTSAALMQRIQARQAGTLDKAPEVSRQKVGELLGINVARSLAAIGDELDVAALVRGVKVAAEKGQPLLSDEGRSNIRNALIARQQQRAAQAGEENRKKGEAFLAENAKVRGVVTTRSGLQYQVERPGNGARPLPPQQVRVHYEGRLLDGKVFDSSYQRGTPAEFALNRVIPGWTEGVGLMAPGAKYRFWIPAELAYGERGSPPNIGPNETLVFDVELLDVLN